VLPAEFRLPCANDKAAYSNRHTWYAYLSAMTRIEELKRAKKLTAQDARHLDDLASRLEVAKQYSVAVYRNLMVFSQRDALPGNQTLSNEIDKVFDSSINPGNNSQLPPRFMDIPAAYPEHMQLADESKMVDITAERFGPAVDLTYADVLAKLGPSKLNRPLDDPEPPPSTPDYVKPKDIP
jgi:hypothetical protein